MRTRRVFVYGVGNGVRQTALSVDAQIDLLAACGMDIRIAPRPALPHPRQLLPASAALRVSLRTATHTPLCRGRTRDGARHLRLRPRAAAPAARRHRAHRNLPAHHLAQHLASTYGPFAHDNLALFRDSADWHKSQDELRKEYGRSRETFAKHYRQRYPELVTPPVWVACELMTLGHLSRWLKNLAKPDDRQRIADHYGLDERVLLSFAHHLTVVRNHCAHHGRVWNRRFALRFTPPTKKPRHIASAFNPGEPQLIYNTLTMLAYLLDLLSPAHTWRREIHALLAAHPEIDPAAMGFPAHWRETDCGGWSHEPAEISGVQGQWGRVAGEVPAHGRFRH
jgi:hypothetical protein